MVAAGSVVVAGGSGRRGRLGGVGRARRGRGGVRARPRDVEANGRALLDLVPGSGILGDHLPRRRVGRHRDDIRFEPLRPQGRRRLGGGGADHVGHPHGACGGRRRGRRRSIVVVVLVEVPECAEAAEDEHEQREQPRPDRRRASWRRPPRTSTQTSAGGHSSPPSRMTVSSSGSGGRFEAAPRTWNVHGAGSGAPRVRPWMRTGHPTSVSTACPGTHAEPHYVEQDGLRLHYVDEGSGRRCCCSTASRPGRTSTARSPQLTATT